jgi:hypothetical protein
MALGRTALALAAMLTIAVDPAVAGPASLLGEGFLGGGGAVTARRAAPLMGGATPLIPARHEAPEASGTVPLIARSRGDMADRPGGSLFVGQAAGFFAPLPPREVYRDLGGTAISELGPNASAVERLRYIIGHAESRADGYDAINYGAKRLPERRPTEMTLGEIYAWIAATPGQPHAIGRYQFIPSTLKRLAQEIGAGPHERFTPRLQDLLADELLREAGLHALLDGLMPRRQFMNNLAKIWAGLPNSSGRSHYHGYAGNRASMTWAQFEAEMAKIFPT